MALTDTRSYQRLEFMARQVVEGFITGLHKSPFHGFSVEFAEHRLYNSGESTRYIDWKLYGRTDKLFIKKYEEETNLRCQLVLDLSSSMLYPYVEKPDKPSDNKLTFSVHCAAAFFYMLRKQRDACGLTLFSEKVEKHLPARSGISQQRALFGELEKLLHPTPHGLNKKTKVSEALHQVAEIIHKRSLVVIFSDMLDDAEPIEELIAALQHLRHNRHEVVLFHVMDQKDEMNFDFENRLYQFIDLETSEEIKLNPFLLKEEIRQKMKEKEQVLKLKCGQYRIDFVAADIRKGFHQVLMPFLIKRSKML